jgi:hypothetical protein
MLIKLYCEKFRFALLFILSLVIFSFPYHNLSLSQSADKYTEITKTDITLSENITSAKINVFGAHLGMKMADVKSLFKDNPQVSLEIDKFNPFRYYLYDKSFGKAKKVAVAYFIWDEKTHILKEITLYQEFVKFTKGKTYQLFSQDVFQKESEIVKYFLGLPYKKKQTLDIPSIGLKAYCYYYYRNFMITKNISDEGTNISLSLIIKGEK